mgnify:CR=1 FL=1
MDLEIVERVPSQIERDGRTTAPAHTLYDIVRKLREGAQIEIEASGERNSMVLRSGRSTFTLQSLPPEDYPVMAGGELPHNFALSAAELRTLIDRTRFAISTEETRYYLNGIYLHATKNEGCRLSARSRPTGIGWRVLRLVLPEGAAAMPGVIIPRKTVLELRKLVDESQEEVQVALSETKIRFAIGEAALTSKLIDGTFPDYDRVIPSNNDKILEVDCKSFAEAVDRVSTISTEKSRAVKLAIESGSLVVSATSPENGTAVEELEVRYLAQPVGNRLQLAIPPRHRRANRRRGCAIRHVGCRLADDRPRQRRCERALRADADAGVSAGNDRRCNRWQNSALATPSITDVGRGTGSSAAAPVPRCTRVGVTRLVLDRFSQLSRGAGSPSAPSRWC